MHTPKIIVIVGPTSSGKTSLGIELARAIDGEIISADSRQVYKGLDIGTGKVTTREMKSIPHHLLDVASPKKIFSAGDFTKRGRKIIADIIRRGKVPIIVGGTGFYIDTLVGRIEIPDAPRNEAFRKKIANKTTAQLFALLKKKDPDRAATIDEHNRPRLERALEIAEVLGKNPPPKTHELYEILWLGITLPKETLEKNIATRLTARIRTGMIAEAKKLRRSGLSYKRMYDLGLEYRHLADLLKNNTPRSQFFQNLLTDIRQFARRQEKYWKRNSSIQWLKGKDLKAAQKLAKTFLKQ